MPGEFDMGRMQEEAVRRAREMQSRARFPRGPLPRPPEPRPESPREEEPQAEASPAASEHMHSTAPSSPPAISVPGPVGNVLETLLQDKERTIILALLLLLSGEEGNHELLFALMFLLI